MRYLVSILIPCYNSASWVAETLESALAQTYSKIEIIVVDDGSTDETFEIAKQYACSNLKVIRQINKGQCAAENRAIREAQGNFIQYLDADDLLAPDKIERQMALLGTRETEYVSSCEWTRFYESPERATFKYQPLWRDLQPIDWLVCAWENHLMMHGAAWLIPRQIIDKAGLWDERLSLINDFDYFSRILLASKGIKFCPGARTYYRSGNESSLSATISRQARQSQFLSLCLGTATLLNAENSSRTRRTCANIFQRFIYETYPDVSELRHQAREKVHELGGTELKASGGPFFNLVAAIAGWKTAKHAQRLLYRYGYRKVALGKKLVSSRGLAN